MSVLISAFVLGVACGLRAIVGLAAVSWAANRQQLPLQGTWLSFLGFRFTPYITSLLALVEIINDKLPNTPSRKVPPQFITRIVMGGFSGAALGASHESLVLGLLAGAVGAVVGTLGGAEFRSRLVKAIGGNDLPIALLEDVIAVVGAYLIVSHT